MNMGKKQVNKKEIIADQCGFPKDVILGAPILSMVGNHEAIIENFKNILNFTECMIAVRCKEEVIEIQGRDLTISFYSKEELRIKGRIEAVYYHG